MLGFTQSNFYYQPKIDTSEDVLREEIEQLSLLYPTYGYRRITQLLVRSGYTVGYKRVARLMKSVNLSVAVKRSRQTRNSIDGVPPGAIALKTFMSPAMRSRLGGAILPTSGSKDTSSMFVYSWMSSRA